MNEKPLRIVQISDIHLFLDKNMELLGVKTLQSFTELIQLIKSDPAPPDMIILSGDLSQDRTEESYRYVAEVFKPFSAPVYCIPGNHDDADIMKRVYPYETVSDLRNIVLDHWNIVLLNSQKRGAVEGYMDHGEFEFLKKSLTQHPDLPAIIMFHHHPVLVGSKWLDKLGLTNANEFWEIIANYPQVHTIFFGHVHQQIEGKKNGIPYYSVPSTCIQFKKHSDEFALDEVGPAYRWIDLYSKGKLKTGVKRLDHYVGFFDVNATGY
jgi:Icc protein